MIHIFISVTIFFTLLVVGGHHSDTQMETAEAPVVKLHNSWALFGEDRQEATHHQDLGTRCEDPLHQHQCHCLFILSDAGLDSPAIDDEKRGFYDLSYPYDPVDHLFRPPIS